MMNITPDERKDTEKFCYRVTDEELKQAMSDVWEQYETKATSPVAFEQIARKLSLNPNHP